ncbi:MAG TPA: hypothetical protein VFK78_00010 [Gemmatimonadales bacterium]|nr:hypothetical protein [Gemmatimonadales bacterium]
MPLSRVVRWMALGALILFALALYFRDGLRVSPLSGTPADTAVVPATR